MKKLLIIAVFTVIFSITGRAYAQLSVYSVPNPQSIATQIETTVTAANTKVQTALQDIRNAQAVQEATAAFKQFNTYQNDYYEATGFLQNLKQLDGVSSFLQNYKQFIPSVQGGAPNDTLDQNLVNYVNGLGNKDLSAANPWDNAIGVNSTQQDMTAISQAAINSESSTAALDSTEAQKATTAGHLISTQATSANGLDAERLSASANGKIIELLSEILQNQAVENQANAAQQAQQLRYQQELRYQQQKDTQTNQSLATSLSAGW